MDEIDLGTFIQTMLIVSSLELRAAAPSDPTTKVTTTIKAASTPWVVVVDKGNGIYVSLPKKMPPTKLKGITIGALAVTMPFRGV